jgi:type IV pilus assembly protein PilW
MKTFHINSPQRGFTLIELMIAMLIGVFLMGGVIQIFLSAKQAYRLQENLSRLQENGRFAMDMIAQDTRMAGYVDTVCLPTTATAPQSSQQALLQVANADKTDSTTNWCSPATGSMGCISSIPSSGTNSSTTAQNTTAPANTTAGNVRTDAIRSYQWFSPTNCTVAGLNATGTEISYFIKADDSNSNVASLWRYPGSNAINTAQERVEGIETMYVLYGVDTDATPDYIPNYYADAGSADLTKIVSVRITLVAVTTDIGLTDTPQPYTFNGMKFTPPNVCVNNGAIASASPPPCTAPATSVPDTRIRRVFSSTIAVRNRLR